MQQTIICNAACIKTNKQTNIETHLSITLCMSSLSGSYLGQIVCAIYEEA